MHSSRPPGNCVMSCALTLVQGTLLFLGLLLLLWVPLLVFSSGNPTYQVSKELPKNHQIGNRLTLLMYPVREQIPCNIYSAQSTLVQKALALRHWVGATQVPEVLSFSCNATLGTAGGAAAPGQRGPRESVSFPLFSAGERRSQAPWAGTGSLPLSMQEAYTPSQVQLLCAAEVRIGPISLGLSSIFKPALML